MPVQAIQGRGDSLEEARAHLLSQVPEGLCLLSEEVLCDGQPQTVRVWARTDAQALLEARRKVPPDARVLEEPIVRAAEAILSRVRAPSAADAWLVAFQEAAPQGRAHLSLDETILEAPGGKRFLLFGRRLHRYVVRCTRDAEASVTYKRPARVSGVVGPPGTKLCALCGKAEERSVGGDMIVSRPEAFENMVAKCRRCGTLMCGACAKPVPHVRARPDYAEEVTQVLAYYLRQHRKPGEIMDEVHRRFPGAAELMFTYACPRCDGDIGPPDS